MLPRRELASVKWRWTPKSPVKHNLAEDTPLSWAQSRFPPSGTTTGFVGGLEEVETPLECSTWVLWMMRPWVNSAAYGPLDLACLHHKCWTSEKNGTWKDDFPCFFIHSQEKLNCHTRIIQSEGPQLFLFCLSGLTPPLILYLAFQDSLFPLSLESVIPGAPSRFADNRCEWWDRMLGALQY